MEKMAVHVPGHGEVRVTTPLGLTGITIMQIRQTGLAYRT